MAIPDETLTVEEAAALMGCTVSWMYQLRLQGRGPLSTRVGRRLQYRRVDVEYWMARRIEASTRGGKL